MTLIQSIASKQHTPAFLVYLDGRQIDARQVLAVPRVTFDMESRIGEAEVRLRSKPDWFDWGQDLEVRLGWDGVTIPVFKGTVPENGLEYGPAAVTLLAQGAMAKAETEVSVEAGKSWASKTQVEIITDCLDACAVTLYDLEGDATALGTIEDITLADGASYASLINELDQCFNYYTFDCPDGVVRRRLYTGQPTSTAAFAYEQGDNVIGEIRFTESIRGLRNRVVVTGHPDGESQAGAYAAQQADSDYVPNPPRYRVHKFQSSLIESDAVATTVATRKMLMYNRPSGQLTFETPGNPYLMPGMTISLEALGVGLSAATNFVVKGLTHSLTPDGGFVSQITTEGGVGDAGYATGRPPLAGFT